MDNEQPQDSEVFEISLRILGNEIFAMNILSKSAKKNWVIFGIITLVLLTLLANQLSPAVLALFSTV